MKGKGVWSAVLCLCLLAGCGGEGEKPEGTPEPTPVITPVFTSTPEPVETPEPAPTPSPKPELPQEALALLELGEGDTVMDWATGDLNGDGIEDWAVVVEGSGEEKPEGHLAAGPRKLVILLGDGAGGFQSGQTNDHFIRRADQGGVFGDPYEGIGIEDGEFQYRAYGGSSWRWWEIYHFSWQGDGLLLKTAEYINYTCVSEELGGYQDRYDFSTGEYTRHVWCGAGGEMDGKLLWGEPISVTAPRLEDLPNVEETAEPWVELPPLPGLPDIYAAVPLYTPAQQSPEAMLDKAKETYHPEMYRVDIPWTEETRANYSAAVGYPVPSYYYTDGKAILYYYKLEVQGEDWRPYQHSIWYEGKDYSEDWRDYEVYRYWDETGEELGR